MAKDANWRFDPFTNLFNYQPIAGEPQTVGFLTEWGIYGFILDESPRIQSGSDTLTVIEDVPGGAQWVEIDSALNPAPGEYRLDKTFEMAIVEFNPADDGRSFLVSYEGKGTVINVKKIREMVAAGSLSGVSIDTLLTVNGDLAMTGGAMTFNGIPVTGFLDDGTPFFTKILRGDLLPGNGSTLMTHGLGNIASEKRIVGGSAAIINYAGGLGDWTHDLVSHVIRYRITNNHAVITRTTGTQHQHVLASIHYVLP